MKRKQLLVLTLSLILLLSNVAIVSATEMDKFEEQFVKIPAGNHYVPGILTLPLVNKDQKVPAVLMLHGWASNKDEVGDMYKNLAHQLASKGIASLRIDFAGSGDSEQEYFENNMDLSIADSQKALTYLLTHQRIDYDKVGGVLGFSQGGAIGQAVVAREPQVKAFATWSTARGNGISDNSLEAKEAKENGFVMVDSFRGGPLKQSKQFYVSRENARALDEITMRYNGALLVVAGSEDTVVDPDISHELVNSVKSNDKTLRILEGADHIFNVLSEDNSLADKTINLTANWFEDKLILD